jgi:signal transduction histidine kinase
VTSSELAEVRLAAGTRLLALLALSVPVVLSHSPAAMVGLVILAAIWMTALAVRAFHVLPPLLVITFEAIAVGVTLGAGLRLNQPLVGALAVAPILGGGRSGARGALQAAAAEALALVFTALQLGLAVPSDVAGAAVTWLITGVGFGFLAGFVRSVRAADADTLTPYRDARELISQLLDLSGRLSEGLDPVSISQRVIQTAREEIPFVGGVVYVKRGVDLTPLVDSAETAALDTVGREAVVEQCWESALPVILDSEISFPLRTDAGVVAVVAGALPAGLAAAQLSLQGELKRLTKRFHAEALHLDTALLFATVRDEATTEERRRLAREVHDGVAQDVASLGYLIDDLEESATTPEQTEVFQQLRSEITGVVAELRRSVFSLRNEARTAGSLGESISALARHVTTVTGIPVHVALDEGPSRLRTEVEAELLRIAQEGMNNAVRHGQPDNIWVEVTVKAPSADIVVRDDGRGLQGGRHDSHGVRIMNERATLIGARFDLRNADNGGTLLRVSIDRTSAETRTEGA